jgi:hypothetical protein
MENDLLKWYGYLLHMRDNRILTWSQEERKKEED